MRDLVPESTPPETPPPSRPLLPWEDHPAFRFTFLMLFTQEGDRQALEHLGKMLYDAALELSGKWPPLPESSTRAEMRAVQADLQHAEAVLASIAQSRHVASLSPEDERLSLSATELSHMVGRYARIIESLIGPLWTGGIRK